jgi:hypothetical protein
MSLTSHSLSFSVNNDAALLFTGYFYKIIFIMSLPADKEIHPKRQKSISSTAKMEQFFFDKI